MQRIQRRTSEFTKSHIMVEAGIAHLVVLVSFRPACTVHLQQMSGMQQNDDIAPSCTLKHAILADIRALVRDSYHNVV